MGEHRNDTDFQNYSTLQCWSMLERRRNILIFNKTIFTSNTCENSNVETVNHIADFMRMTKHDLNNAEPAEFTTSSRCLWNRVCLELLPEEF